MGITDDIIQLDFDAMEIRRGIIHLNRQKISDLLGKGVIEGPLHQVRIEKSDIPIFGTGYERCRKEADRIARKSGFSIAESTYDSWMMGRATMDFNFYRFKFYSTDSSSSGHHEQDQDSR